MKNLRVISSTMKALSAFICTSASLFTFSLTANAAGLVGVKWHPGHYIEPQGSNKSISGSTMISAYNEMEANPAFKGIQVRLHWGNIETSKDVYNFTLLDQHLNKLATTGSKKKRLVLLLRTKGGDTLVPDYISNPSNPQYLPAYEKGVYPWGNNINGTSATEHKGDGIKFWSDAIRDRFVILLKKLGERYNNHLHFEAIGLSESALGQPLIYVSDANITKFYDNIVFIHNKMRVAFPNTVTFQFLNYPRDILAKLINSFKLNGTGVGGPDVWLNDNGMTTPQTPYNDRGIYTYYPELSNLVALAPSVMSGNYVCSRADCNASKGNFTPTVKQLLDYARSNLKANYIFWSRDPNHFSKVYNMLNTYRLNNNPDGKLISTCPSKYGTCITD